MSGEKIPKLERLLNLTALLLETRRPLTVEEIGAKMQGYPDDPMSFRRQFERDKDDLRRAGVPLEVEPDPLDRSEFRYRIPPERYYLPDPGFTEDETAALRVAIASISLDDEAARAALLKFGIGADDDPTAPVASVAAPPVVAALRVAIAEHRTATFDYKGERRTVEPHRLTYANGRWYVTGFDRARDDVRNFRIDRLDGDVQLGEPGAFVPPTEIEGLSVEPWRYGDDEPVEVTVRVDADLVPVVRRRFGRDARWNELPSGDAEVTCTVRGRWAFRSFLLSLLDHAEIVGPAELRTWFVDSLRAVGEVAS